MGKKRNNAAKKKQVAKKKKLSAAFGVSVSKGGTISKNNGIIELSVTADGNVPSKNQKTTPATNSHGSPNNTRRTSGDTNSAGKRSRTQNSEQDEFNRLHAGLQERSLASQAKSDNEKRIKKEKQKRQKKGWGNFARPNSKRGGSGGSGGGGGDFSPAILNLAPKSTQEMVDEAADRVAQGFVEIGQRIVPHVAPAPGMSSLAAAAGSDWKNKVVNSSIPETLQTQQTQQSLLENNPWSALDESDDDLEGGKKMSVPVRQFQFQPASFSFQPSVSDVAPIGPVVQEEDPDPDL